MAVAEHTVTVRRYTSEHAETWNRFVEICRNGTFLHDRRYMEYHADRFDDHSLMFMCEDELIAIMPAHIKNGTFCSHNGLTYGGLLPAGRGRCRTQGSHTPSQSADGRYSAPPPARDRGGL